MLAQNSNIIVFGKKLKILKKSTWIALNEIIKNLQKDFDAIYIIFQSLIYL